MAKKTPNRRAARPTGRELVLAGIGAVSLARKQARAAVQAAGDRVAGLRSAATAEGDRVRARVEARVATARKAIAPVLEQVQQRATRLAADAPAQLQPLLTRIGLAQAKPAKKVARAKRAPAHRTTTSRKPARRAA